MRFAVFLATLLAAAFATAQSPVTTGGRDAKECIAIKFVPAVPKDGLVARQSITNTCNEPIGVIFCHTPSSTPGTKGTECGNNGRYFQQFSTYKPGDTKANQFSMPPDAKIAFGACFGGEGKIKQTTNGEYNCRP